ncbi:MAG: DUF2497 domain-containing protein [Proteobacteria bacterium]|nr:DUF2497 domain-containing protein [Pseudomonadota bacterium]
MAQPGVAREPSMEEILASIRRIIESNEPATASSGPMMTTEPVMDESEDDFYVETAHPVISDSLGTPLRAANSIGATPSRPADKPQSLADIAARVRNAAAAAVPPAPMVHPEPMEEPILRSPLMTERQEPVFTSVADVQPEAAAPVIASVEMPSRPTMDLMEALAPVVGEDMMFEEPELPMETERMPLVSNATGALVARSFDDLAEAVDGARRRSLDEIAEDMLRPMLREWLDDNLPTLVERLVREEIERVARGPRR